MSLSAKASLVVILALAIAADILFPGWGRSVLSTGLVFGGMIVVWPHFWDRWWFWVSIVPPLIVQSFVLYRYAAVRAFLEQLNSFALFTLLIAEGVALSIPLQVFVTHSHIPTDEIDRR